MRSSAPSRQLAIGPTSAISMLIGATLLGMAEGDPLRWAQIAALTALIFAVDESLRRGRCACRHWWTSSAKTILLGFKAGAALTIAMTQLPKLFGVPGGGENFFERGWTLARSWATRTSPSSPSVSAAIAALVAGERFLPGRPVALFVVALSIVALSLTPLAQLGFKTVGVLPAGLPDFYAARRCARASRWW
jgi:MFS superfamily sulfate permease-like transporter